MTCKYNIIDWVNLTVKYGCKYTNGKILSVYTEEITEGITTRFKKGKSYGDVVFVPKKWPTKLFCQWIHR